MARSRQIARSSSGRRLGSPFLVVAATMLFATAALGAEFDAPAKEVEDRASRADPTDQGARDLIRSKGAFAKLWNEQSFIGPRVLTLAGESSEAVDIRLPSDFESHKAVIIAGGWLAREAPDVPAGIVRKTNLSKDFVLLASSASEQALTISVLAKRGLTVDASQLRIVPTDTGWVRDYGPVCVRGPAGKLLAFDAAYDKPGRDRDDTATAAIADLFQVSTTVTPLRWQGGNLLSNGKGLLVTTTQSINANIEFGNDMDTVTRFLRRRFGVNQLVVLEHLQGERTGHIDMFCCFTSPDTLVVGNYDESVDPRNAALLDRNAARLAEIQIGQGKLNVVRIPMATNDDGLWRSSTNVVFANGALLVPVYPDVDPTGGKGALAVYRRLLPTRKVIEIDASTMARHQGGLRCVTLYVPESGEGKSDSVPADPLPVTDQ